MTPRKPTRAKQLGVSDEEYARLLAAQGGHCALCPNTPKTEHDPVKPWTCRYCRKRNLALLTICDDCKNPRLKPPRLHTDHDHATGKVRGLLCYVCNKYLPASRDANWHVRAAVYLTPKGEPLSFLPVTRAQRDALILRERRHGWTYARIAAHYGVTRQRAWQIVTKAGKA